MLRRIPVSAPWITSRCLWGVAKFGRSSGKRRGQVNPHQILAGAEQADAGEIWLGGQRVRYDSPVEALRLGIGAIYQEFNLVPQLNVAQNIMLGQVPKKWGRASRYRGHAPAGARNAGASQRIAGYAAAGS